MSNTFIEARKKAREIIAGFFADNKTLKLFYTNRINLTESETEIEPILRQAWSDL